MEFDWEDNVCFVCGAKAPGLQVTFHADDRGVWAETAVQPPYQGFSGYVHGGILAGLLDDAMWHAVHQAHHVWPLTAELTVRYHRPVGIGQTVRIHGWLTAVKRRILEAEAVVSTLDGERLASAHGRFMERRGAGTGD